MCWRSQPLSPTRRPIAALMRRTTRYAIQLAVFGTTFSASGGGPPLVRWLLIGRNAYKGPHSSTKRTHTACMTDGREGNASALPRCKLGNWASITSAAEIRSFTNRRCRAAALRGLFPTMRITAKTDSIVSAGETNLATDARCGLPS